MSRAGAIVALVAACLSATARGAGLRRFAVVVGNDHGGEGTRPLRYAEDDARRIYDILVRLGGVLPEDAQLLLGRDAGEILRALDRAERRGVEAMAGGEKTALLVYYSGHAMNGALRLGNSAVPLVELKQRLERSRLDIRVAFLDACRSGVITRTKGAHLAPAFEVDDGAARGAHGIVILTSSAENEDSQESDALQGSFFSHYLDSALLGDGDTSGDGRVTLSEAYAYAYGRTVAQTAGTLSGVQHPTYAYELAGNGDLVLTDVASRREGLLVPASAPDGVYWIVDDKGAIAAEVAKRTALDRRIALAPGAYVITRRLADHLRLGSFHVRSGELTVLDEPSLRDASFSDDPVKGGLEVRAPLRMQPLLGAGVGVSTFLNQPSGLFASAPLLGVRLDFDHGMSDRWGGGFGLWLGGSRSALAVEGRSLAFRYGAFVASGDVFYDLFPGRFWNPYLDGRLAYLVLTRTFDDPSLPKQIYATFAPGLAAGIRPELVRPLAVNVELASSYVLYTLGTPASFFYVELDARLAWEL